MATDDQLPLPGYTPVLQPIISDPNDREITYLRQRMAKRLRKAREEQGYSRRVAAALLGCSPHTVWYYENHKCGGWPSVLRLLRMADVYHVSTDYLLHTRSTALQSLVAHRAVDMTFGARMVQAAPKPSR